MKFTNGAVWENARIEYETVEEFTADVLLWTREGFTFSLSSNDSIDVGRKPFTVQYQRQQPRSSRAAFGVQR